jgi:hypothetical protein
MGVLTCVCSLCYASPGPREEELTFSSRWQVVIGIRHVILGLGHVILGPEPKNTLDR